MLTKVGLDLGYANIMLSDASSGIYTEQSLALVDRKTRRVLAVGNSIVGGEEDAATEQGMPVRPFKNGLLYSAEITRAVIDAAFSAVPKADKMRCLLAVPSEMNAKQEEELIGIVKEAGATECAAVNRAVAAFIGAEMKPDASGISVNVGAGATEIAVFEKGQILFQSTAHVGGEDFDKAVRLYIEKVGEVNVTLAVARRIKERLGAVWEGRPNDSVDIEGTLTLTGHRVHMTVTTEDFLDVFTEPLKGVLMAVADIVKKIPFEKVPGIFKTGILLTGGGAELFGLDRMMEKVLGVKVTLVKNPGVAVAKGLTKINLLIPLGKKIDGKNISSDLLKYYLEKNQEPAQDGKKG